MLYAGIFLLMVRVQAIRMLILQVVSKALAICKFWGLASPRLAVKPSSSGESLPSRSAHASLATLNETGGARPKRILVVSFENPGIESIFNGCQGLRPRYRTATRFPWLPFVHSDC